MAAKKAARVLAGAGVLILGISLLSWYVDDEDSDDNEDVAKSATPKEDAASDDDDDKNSDDKVSAALSPAVVQLMQLGAAAQQKGDLSSAFALNKRALMTLTQEALKANRDLEPNGMALIYAKLGSLKLAMEEAVEAEEYMRKVIEVGALAWGEAPSQNMATALNNLGGALLNQGRQAEALEVYERCLAMSETVHGEDDTETATAMGNYATVLQDLKRFAEAQDMFVKSLAIKMRDLGAEHPSTATTKRGLAACVSLRERYEVTLWLRDDGAPGGARELVKADVTWAPAVALPGIAAAAAAGEEDLNLNLQGSEGEEAAAREGALALEVAVAEPFAADTGAEALGSAHPGNLKLGSLEGKAVLCTRGGCAFSDKAAAAEARGAALVIVANNDAEKPEDVFTMGCAPGARVGIPVVMVSFADGKALRRACDDAAAAAGGGAPWPTVELRPRTGEAQAGPQKA